MGAWSIVKGAKKLKSHSRYHHYDTDGQKKWYVAKHNCYLNIIADYRRALG